MECEGIRAVNRGTKGLDCSGDLGAPAAKKYDISKYLLDKLAMEKPGFDIDKRYGAMYIARGKIAEGQRIFRRGGQYYEKAAPTSAYPRGFYLKAVDEYLDGKLYREAQELLLKICQQYPDYDTDLRFARILLQLNLVFQLLR